MDTPYDLLVGVITQHIGVLKPTPSGFSKRNCMMCSSRGHSPDTRERFGINMSGTTIGMNCFNCKFHAGWEPGKTLSKDFIEFLKVMGVPTTDIKKMQFELFKERKSGVDVQLVSIERDIRSKWVPVDLPEHARPLSYWIEEQCVDANFLQVAKYAMGRGLYDTDRLYWTPINDMQYSKRLILPFHYRGNIVGYTARYCKEVISKAVPKYLNTMPAGYLFNLDMQLPDNKYLILCEGVMDAFHLHGVSPLHNSINADQAKIVDSFGKQVILIPHRDWPGMELVDAANKYGWAVSFPPWDKQIKDASEAVAKYGRIATMQSIIEHAEYNKLKTQLTRKLGKYVNK